MHRVLGALIGATLLLSAGGAGATTLRNLAWLEGDWIRETRRGLAVERWSVVSDHTLEGVGTLQAGDTSRVTEYLRLEQFGDELFYVAKPEQNEYPTGFRLVDAGEGEWVFENPTHDFPQRIRYRREGDDVLVVTIEGPMDGEERSIAFRFTRRKD